jgi:hypothetical protein
LRGIDFLAARAEVFAEQLLELPFGLLATQPLGFELGLKLSNPCLRVDIWNVVGDVYLYNTIALTAS